MRFNQIKTLVDSETGLSSVHYLSELKIIEQKLNGALDKSGKKSPKSAIPKDFEQRIHQATEHEKKPPEWTGASKGETTAPPHLLAHLEIKKSKLKIIFSTLCWIRLLFLQRKSHWHFNDRLNRNSCEGARFESPISDGF